MGNSKLNPQKSKLSGQAMLLSVLLIGGSILAISLIGGYLMIQRLRMSTDAINSTKAIMAADTGIEWELYKEFREKPDYTKPELSNGASFTTYKNGPIIKSVGKTNNIFRAFEINLQGAPLSP